jgi:chromosome segregation ATPase
MSELVEIVDSLENKISKLLHKMELLQQSRLNLEREMESLRSDYEAAQRSVEEWEEKYKSLKLANTMLGSETSKTEAKLKINQLIRELDHCIVQLAE